MNLMLTAVNAVGGEEAVLVSWETVLYVKDDNSTPNKRSVVVFNTGATLVVRETPEAIRSLVTDLQRNEKS